MRALLERDRPMTVRQVFYRLVGLGRVAKTETEYKHTVVRLLTEMRRSGEVPYGWIADSTRWMRRPRTYGSLEDALEQTARTYRRTLWNDQAAYVEVWLEKDALAGVLAEATGPWDVPLLVTRGYPSPSYLAEAAEAIRGCGKPAHLYYFGDRDPSGLDIPRVVEAGIRELAPRAAVHFERVAVTQEQIERWRLPTRPTKPSDSRSGRFSGASVEVDAIPPATLRELAAACIGRHVDRAQLEATKAIERLERARLEELARSWTP